MRTSRAGAGAHFWSPNFYMGCGIDVGTGVAARLTNVQDRLSHIGFCVDEGGGASAQIVNATSFFAQATAAPFVTAGKMSGYFPRLGDYSHGSTISGSGFFLGASNRRAGLGEVQDGLMSTTCVNCVAYEPQGVGFWFSRFSNGVHLVQPHAYRTGFECFFAVGGTHRLTDAICDQPNALRGNISLWGVDHPWPQTSAVRVVCANCPPFDESGSAPVKAIRGTSEQLNTTLVFQGLTIAGRSALDSPSKPSYSYALETEPAAHGGRAAIKVTGASLEPGALGLSKAGNGSPIDVAQ